MSCKEHKWILPIGQIPSILIPIKVHTGLNLTDCIVTCDKCGICEKMELICSIQDGDNDFV